MCKKGTDCNGMQEVRSNFFTINSSMCCNSSSVPLPLLLGKEVVADEPLLAAVVAEQLRAGQVEQAPVHPPAQALPLSVGFLRTAQQDRFSGLQSSPMRLPNPQHVRAMQPVQLDAPQCPFHTHANVAAFLAHSRSEMFRVKQQAERRVPTLIDPIGSHKISGRGGLHKS